MREVEGKKLLAISKGRFPKIDLSSIFRKIGYQKLLRDYSIINF